MRPTAARPVRPGIPLPARHVGRVRTRAAAELARADQHLGVRLPPRPEELAVLSGERALVCGAQQVRAVDQLALVVEDRRLDGPAQEVLGVPAEELVQGVLSGHVDRQPAAAPAGPAPHLAQRRHRAGEGHHHRGVELPDVDPELQGVGCDHGQELAAGEPALELAALLRGVARTVGRDLAGQLLVRARHGVGDEPAQDLHALSRLHEADRPGPAEHQARDHLRGLGERRRPRARGAVGQRRVPDRDPPLRRGRAVAVDERDVLVARQPLGELRRVGDRGRGEHEPGFGA